MSWQYSSTRILYDVQLFPSEDVFQLLRTSFGCHRTFGGSLTELLLGLSLFLSVLHTYNTFPSSVLSPLSAIESCLETGGFALVGVDSEAKTQLFAHSLGRELSNLAAFKQSTHPDSETAVCSFCPSGIIFETIASAQF